jgi:ATP-dependent DNA helicase RecG
MFYFGDNLKTKKKGSQKSSQKSSQKIVDIMKNNLKVTIAELAEEIGISERAIKKHIAALKKKDIIRRIGSDRGGYWEINKK